MLKSAETRINEINPAGAVLAINGSLEQVTIWPGSLKSEINWFTGHQAEGGS